MIYLAVVLIGCATGLVGCAGAEWLLSDDRQVRRVLRQVSSYEADQAAEMQPLLRPLAERIVAPVVRRLSKTLQSARLTEYRLHLRAKLAQAGEPGGMDVDRILGIKAICGTLGTLVLVPVGVMYLGNGDGLRALAAFVLAPLTFFLPDLWLRTRISARQTEIRRQLPEMLDILTISVEAGLGFDSALIKLVRKSAGPLPHEFGRMLQEIHAGVARKEAMRHLAERCNVPEVKTFATAMIQADVFGVSVSQILKTQAAEMRLRRRQRAEELAQQAPVKLVFPVILCILPATMLVVLGPAVISIAKMFGGG